MPYFTPHSQFSRRIAAVGRSAWFTGGFPARSGRCDTSRHSRAACSKDQAAVALSYAAVPRVRLGRTTPP